MARKTIGVLGIGLAIFILAHTAQAQGIFADDRADLSFSADDGMIYLALRSTAEPVAEPAPAEKKLKSSSWGGFGGPFGSYLMMDFDALEPLTEDRGMDSNFDNYLVLIGGMGGMIYKDFRFGGFGFGSLSQEVDDEVNGEDIDAEVSIAGGGLFMELNHSFTKNIGALIGVMGGPMAISLEADGSDLGPDEEWSQSETVWFGQPYAGFWLSPVDWFWVQLTGGYLYFDMDSSKYENEDTGMDMMDEDLEPNWQFNANLLFGYNPNK